MNTNQRLAEVEAKATTFEMTAFFIAFDRNAGVIAPQRPVLIVRLQKDAQCESPAWALSHLDSLSVPAETASDFPLAMTKEDSES